MKQKKIWLISKYAVSKEYGNPTRQFFFCKYFAKKGYKTTLISSYAAALEKEITFQNYYKLSQLEGFEHYLLKGPKINLGFSLKRIWSWITFEYLVLRLGFSIEKKDKPDVIIASSLSILTIISAYILKKRYNAKLIFEVRDIWPLTLVEVGGFSKYNPIIIVLSWIEKFGYRHADSIVGTMPNLSAHIEGIFGKKYEKKIYCIPQGFENTANTSSEVPLIKLDNEVFNIAYAGTIGKANDIENIINACIAANNNTTRIKLYLIGNGVLKSSLVEKYREFSNQIIFHDPIPQTQVQQYLSCFDILIISIPSLNIYKFGISPNKIIDYLRSGVPSLIIYDGYKSQIEAANAGWTIKGNSIDEISRKINDIAKINKKELTQLGINGKNYAQKNLTFEVLAEKYLKIIND
jgi:glycosyltransferase involved in cell wall biosynthesis